MTAPSRRWSYSLRTLFVVLTVFGIWLGWTWRNVHKRERLLDSLRSQPQRTSVHSREPQLWVFTSDTRKLPFAWRLFGAEPVDLISRLHGTLTEDDLRQSKWLLPDAAIVIFRFDERKASRVLRPDNDEWGSL